MNDAVAYYIAAVITLLLAVFWIFWMNVLGKRTPFLMASTVFPVTLSYGFLTHRLHFAIMAGTLLALAAFIYERFRRRT